MEISCSFQKHKFAHMIFTIGSHRYLHETCSPHIIHKNFKSANILLDAELNPHISDCGLSNLVTNVEDEVVVSCLKYQDDLAAKIVSNLFFLLLIYFLGIRSVHGIWVLCTRGYNVRQIHVKE